jgi:hypothetical protein
LGLDLLGRARRHHADRHDLVVRGIGGVAPAAEGVELHLAEQLRLEAAFQAGHHRFGHSSFPCPVSLRGFRGLPPRPGPFGGPLRGRGSAKVDTRPDSQRNCTDTGRNRPERPVGRPFHVELTVLAGHQNVVQDAVFNSAGQQILTVSDDKTARTWLVLEAFLGDDQMRRDHACEYLRRTGTHQFTDREMEDPILSGRADLRSPCERFGWLHPEYYGRMMTRLWTWIEGGWQSSASNPKLN